MPFEESGSGEPSGDEETPEEEDLEDDAGSGLPSEASGADDASGKSMLFHFISHNAWFKHFQGWVGQNVFSMDTMSHSYHHLLTVKLYRLYARNQMYEKARQAGEENVSNAVGVLFAGCSAYLIFREKKIVFSWFTVATSPMFFPFFLPTHCLNN